MKTVQKWPKTRIFFIYFGVQSSPKIGLVGPIFSTPLKVLQWACKATLICKLWENDQRLEFWLILWPKNWTSEAHILQTSESSYNEHVKQNWCETSGNFLRKWLKDWNSGIQNCAFVHISESSSNEHIKQDWCESKGTFLTKQSQTLIFTYLKAQTSGSLGPIFYTPTKVAPTSL